MYKIRIVVYPNFILLKPGRLKLGSPSLLTNQSENEAHSMFVCNMELWFILQLTWKLSFSWSFHPKVEEGKIWYLSQWLFEAYSCYSKPCFSLCLKQIHIFCKQILCMLTQFLETCLGLQCLKRVYNRMRIRCKEAIGSEKKLLML